MRCHLEASKWWNGLGACGWVSHTHPRGPRETLPGPIMWVRPATGWWGRMNAGESPRNQGRSVWPPLSAHRRRSRGLRKNAAVERREVNAHRTGRAPQGVSMLPAPFGAPLPSRLVREHSPRERGDGNARRSPRLARTGAAELYLFLSGCLTSDASTVEIVRDRAKVSMETTLSPKHTEGPKASL